MKFFVHILIVTSFLYAQSSLSERYTTLNELEQKIIDWNLEFGTNQDPFPFVEGEGVIFHHEIIGYSGVDNLPIWAIKLSFNANIDEDEPKMLILGQCHAEEIYGLEISIELIEWLLNPTNPGNSIYAQSILSVLSQSEIWIIPTHNPEGLNVVHGWYDAMSQWQQDVFFRKNKYDANQNNMFDFVIGAGDDIDGVDLNRNYDFNWIFGDEFNQLDTGCSANPSYLSNYDYYRGPEPFSEPEIIAIRDFALENNFLLSIAYHSSRSGCVSEKVISSWLWEDEKAAPDLPIISKLGEEIAYLIPSEDGLGYYYPGNSISMRGNAHDWFYKETGCIQYLIEAGSSNIQPDNTNLIDDTISRNMQGLMHLLKKGAGTIIQNGPDVNQISGLVTDVSGNPIHAEVEILELTGPMLTPRYTDEFGRFRRLVDEGSYTLKISAFGYETYIGTVSSSNYSITELNIILDELPIYDIQLNITNDENFNLKAFVSYQNNIDEFILENSIELLQYPKGEYEIMIHSEESFPEFISVNLTENVSFDLVVDYKMTLLNEPFDDLIDWDIEGDFLVENGILHSQNNDFYNSNSSFFQKSLIDLSSLDGFEQDLVLKLKLKNEIEWENDKLIFMLESGDGLSNNVITEITGHNFIWNEVLFPFSIIDENKYLKIMFSTDGTVNYRGFLIDNLEILYKGCIKGDLNSSSDVNVEDIIILIDLIFGNITSNEQLDCKSDLNNDNYINVFDVVLLVESILNN